MTKNKKKCYLKKKSCCVVARITQLPVSHRYERRRVSKLRGSARSRSAVRPTSDVTIFTNSAARAGYDTRSILSGV